MVARILFDERDRKAWLAFMSAQPLPCTVSLTKGARRSLPQNSLFHSWVGQIAMETGETQGAAKGEVKLRYGLPIMERDNPAWMAKWEPLYGPLNYAQRVVLFEILPMTSLMTTRQMKELMDGMQRDYLQQGIMLIDPDDLKFRRMYEGAA